MSSSFSWHLQPGGRVSSTRTGGGQVPVVALRGYGVDAAAMSFWLHERGIHIERACKGSVLMRRM
jgi:hypothetical protein